MTTLVFLIIIFIEIVLGRKKKKQVCFVGAGTSTLIWADLLCDKILKNGKKCDLCDNLHFFEQEDKASESSFSQTFKDFAQVAPFGSGLFSIPEFNNLPPSPLYDLLNKYQIPTQPIEEAYGINPDITIATLGNVLGLISVTNPPKFIGETAKLLLLLEPIIQFPTMQDIYRSGISIPGETWLDFCIRNDIQQIGKYLAAALDFFAGYGPTQTTPAIAVLNFLATFNLPIITSILASFNFQTNNTFINSLYANLELSQTNGNLKRSNLIQQGVQLVYDRLVAELKLKGVNFYFNEKVIDVEKHDGNTIYITTNTGKEKICDIAVLSARPNAMLEYLNKIDFPEIIALYNETLIDNQKVFAQFAVQFKKDNVPTAFEINENFFSPSIIAFTGNVLQFYGTSDINNYYCKAILLAAFNSGRTWLFSTQWSPELDITIEQCFEQVHAFLRQNGFNYTNADIVKTKSWFYPSLVPVKSEKNGWYEKLDALQGKDNVLFAGELLSGCCVEPVLKYQISKFDLLYNLYNKRRRRRRRSDSLFLNYFELNNKNSIFKLIAIITFFIGLISLIIVISLKRNRINKKKLNYNVIAQTAAETVVETDIRSNVE